jgi:osmotically-inducible protein OsmY
MKPLYFALLVAVAVSGCSPAVTQSPDVSDGIRHALDLAHLPDVSVREDQAKGIVTLGGHVATDDDKEQAGAMARQFAAGQVVANEIAVRPPGAEREARTIASDLDKGIEQNLDAALIQSNLHDHVTYTVKAGVVTLNGDVDSQRRREEAGRVASGVPNVEQVVNALQVKEQKATSRQ